MSQKHKYELLPEEVTINANDAYHLIKDVEGFRISYHRDLGVPPHEVKAEIEKKFGKTLADIEAIEDHNFGLERLDFDSAIKAMHRGETMTFLDDDGEESSCWYSNDDGITHRSWHDSRGEIVSEVVTEWWNDEMSSKQWVKKIW